MEVSQTNQNHLIQRCACIPKASVIVRRASCGMPRGCLQRNRSCPKGIGLHLPDERPAKYDGRKGQHAAPRTKEDRSLRSKANTVKHLTESAILPRALT